VVGVYFGDWVRHDPHAYRAALNRLTRWASEGKLSCHIHQVYPLAETPQALKALTQRKAMGKVIVQP
jgi:NADPH2:quinone reductase